MSLEDIVFGKQKLEESGDESAVTKKKVKPPVWVDPDDISLTISPEKAKMINIMESITGDVFSQELKERYSKSHETADISWAKVDEEKPSTVDAGELFSSEKLRIPSDNLVVVRLNDMFDPKGSKNGIRQIEFDPNQDQACVLDQNGGVHFVSVSEKSSSLIFSLPFGADISNRRCLCYAADGTHVFVGCGRGQFLTIDIRVRSSIVTKIPGVKDDVISIHCSPSNKVLCMITSNSVHFFDPFNRSHLKSVQTSDVLMCGDFTDDGYYFVCCGKLGRGLVFDCDTLKAINRFQEPEMQDIKAISIARGFAAMGTEAGILHVFDFENLKKEYPKPLFSKLNLTTAIDTVRFNPTGELIVFASSEKQDSMRILHIADKKVYSNWPTARTPISYVRDVAFNSNSQYFVYGNEKGYCRLWELSFYKK